ncbi:excinuclease ABC subunit C [Paenibacillus forsythiae]|uniref:Excinuclease ABC subunit C n=1 Tax=Paenibacillus forsythiae TaxID=365616 RepID=A0ABU3H9J3_9BACL|nr:GIY-YIG nuclease family protein [Paenibacillus forsythiae]MDT3426707.1 excinuclease ABC subunit C [Paenibacillus forsythiae]
MKDKIRSLPLSPGVYLMKDSLDGIIYVGKSKNLRKRVQSYFYNSKSHSKKVKQMVSQIRDLEYRVTDTEFEAFMLECRLIRELKPMYNKKMKNPLAYTYIVIRTSEDLRRIEINNYPDAKDSHAVFGPYTANRNSVERAVQGFQECYKISCAHSSFSGSACLNYSLGLCLGMCLGKEAIAEYNRIIDRFIALLDGSDRGLYEEMNQSMQKAAEQCEFEAAAKYRDCMESLGFILNKEKVIGFTEENRNIVILEYLSEDTLKLFLVKRNAILHREKLAVRHQGMEPLHARIKGLIMTGFGAEPPLSSKVSREEIDEAQIIYSYLKGSACHYLFIPDEWLGPGDPNGMDDALRAYLKNALTPH